MILEVDSKVSDQRLRTAYTPKVSFSIAPVICILFLCPNLLKAGVGHIVIRRDVTSVRVYVTYITRV